MKLYTCEKGWKGAFVIIAHDRDHLRNLILQKISNTEHWKYAFENPFGNNIESYVNEFEEWDIVPETCIIFSGDT